MRIRNAPKCRCGNTMVLVADRLKLTWLCEKCYPNYPKRSRDYPHCPECGKEFNREVNTYWCDNCSHRYTPRLHDIFIYDKDSLSIYNEIDDSQIWYWWKEGVTLNIWEGDKA